VKVNTGGFETERIERKGINVKTCYRNVYKVYLYNTNLSFLHIVQTGFGAHPAYYPMGTGGSFPGGKAAGT
jgi:hypothetical protein